MLEIAVIDVTLPAPLVLDLALVAGPPGSTGPAGPAGPTGAPGPPGPAGTVPTDAIALTDHVSIGTNPAQSGALRLSSTSEIKIRNAANTQDIRFTTTDGATYVIVGSTLPLYLDSSADVTLRSYQGAGVMVLKSDGVAIGTNPAQSGALRLANNQPIAARTADNGSDVQLVRVDTQDTISFGSSIRTVVVTGQSLFVRADNLSIQTLPNVNAFAFDSSQFYPFGTKSLGLPSQRWTIGYFSQALNLKETTAPAAPPADTANVWLQDNGAGKSQLMIQFATGAPKAIDTQDGTVTTGDQYVAIGTNPAQSGALRLANNQAIKVRNGANTADQNIVTAAATYSILGDQGVVTYIDALNGVFFRVSGQVDVGMARGGIVFTEAVGPGVANANQAYLFLQDNGAGKSQLMIQFATGVPIAIATQV